MDTVTVIRSCPDRLALEDVAAGAECAQAIKDHVRSCAACQSTIDSIRAEYDLLRRAAQVEPAESPSDVAAPIATMEGYDVVRELHRGGQGVVYRARQKSTGRDVAIKILRDGVLATIADRVRFEREISILGQLQHPHIVAIHDSGAALGHNYLVMDFVRGYPLSELFRGAAAPQPTLSGIRRRTAPPPPPIGPKGNPRATVLFFAKVCDAVAAAHLRGVIHRDLKPANIMVDQDGEPRILDFGLAKIAGDDSDQVTMTVTGQFIGSMPWSSPEQITGAHANVDVRTDVYALGVILYQLLSGNFPYTVTGARNVVENSICNAPPTPLRPLRRDVNHDLETIVFKCLSKERERRYQTAGDLARDLRNYLSGEAIDAKRDSAGYVLRKSIWRYRAPLSVAAALLFTMAAALWVSTSALGRARADAETARLARIEESRQRDATRAANLFLSDVFGSSAPEGQLGRYGTVRAAIDLAAERIDTDFRHLAAETRANLHLTVSRVYSQIGLGDPAKLHLQAAARACRALQNVSSALAADLKEQEAALAADESNFNGAEALLKQALQMRVGDGGEVRAARAGTALKLAQVLERADKLEDAAATCDQAIRALGGPSTDVVLYAKARGYFALLQNRMRHYAEAKRLLESLIEELQSRSERGAALAHALALRASLALEQGETYEAEAAARQARDLLGSSMRESHPTLVDAYATIAQSLESRGTWQQALPIRQRMVALAEAEHEPRHPRVIAAKFGLARNWTVSGQFEEARKLLEQLIADTRDVYGENSRQHADALFEYAAAFETLNGFDAAAQAYESSARIREALIGEDAIDTGEAWHRAARCLNKAGKYKPALAIWERAIPMLRKSARRNDLTLLHALSEAGVLNLNTGRHNDAEPLLREAIERAEPRREDDPKFVATALGNLAIVPMYQKKWDEAEKQLRAALELFERAGMQGDALKLSAQSNLAATLTYAGKPAEAESIFVDLLGIVDRLFPAHDIRCYKTRLSYAQLLLNQKRFGEAESMLRAADDALSAVEPPGSVSHEHKLVLDGLALVLNRMQRCDDAQDVRNRRGP